MMTSDSFESNNNLEHQYISKSNYRSNLNKVIKLLNQIINALGEFKNNYNKKFNFSKLAKYLKIPVTEIDLILSLILNFQEKFNNTFKNYYLKKKIIGNQIYLITDQSLGDKLNLKDGNNKKIKDIYIKKTQSKLFSDFIYTFKYVNRGKGFDLENNGTDLLRNLRNLNEKHPYLFKKNGNNLTYPSALGLKLGDLILSFNKCNKKIKNIELEHYNFIFD